jgi:hypothetical protein
VPKPTLPTVTPDRDDRIYAAGFFDADGCVMVLEAGTGGRGSATLVVTVSNCDRTILDWYKARWGGSIRANGYHRAEVRPNFSWTASGTGAARLLKDTLPFLKVKLDRVQNGLAFQALRPGPGNHLTDEENARDREFAMRAREMNRKGPRVPPQSPSGPTVL